MGYNPETLAASAMKNLILHLLLLGLLSPFSALADSPLRDHPSPYLALHADDPVHWQEWSRETLRQAQEQGKLIFVSSGYYACHWCHVMQRESYRNEAIATLLNEYFVSIKLDRELRPDLDSYLFDFVQQTHGIAGWPLNVFLTPEAQPLLGLVYLPAEDFLQLIEGLLLRWQHEAEELTALAREASRHEQAEPAPSDAQSRAALRDKFHAAMVSALHQQGDFLSGGFGNGSKFPQVPLLALLLEHFQDDADLGELLVLSLDQMMQLGLRDHLGGGFFRYTVDPDWREPHFEKMLYDNAQLAWLYLRAGTQLARDDYRQTGLHTLDFLLRQMWHAQGALIGSLSAVDGSDVEGGYYLWHYDDLERLLSPEQLALLTPLWGLDSSPIWDAGYLPMALLDTAILAEQLDSDPKHVDEQLQQIRQILMRERRLREMPADDKRLAGWNGLALAAFALAHDAHPRYRLAGQQVRHYLHGLWDGEQLWMMRDNQGILRQPASLEDYALVAQGLSAWAQASNDEASLLLARLLLVSAAGRFHHSASWQLSADDDLGMLARALPLIPSGHLPSSAVSLLRLQGELALTELPEKQLLWQGSNLFISDPLQYADYLNLMLFID